MYYKTDDPSFSWFVIPTEENYYTSYTEWLIYQKRTEKLISRFNETS